ncbi:uncharacterized protein LOC120326730 [Styela clava]
MADVEGMIRARQIQDEALAELDAKVKACKESMKNYEHLSGRITTLPDKLSHPVMVPFGKLAFMPGRLVHTNELLVHLGDAWFTTVSCKKALEIVEMRQNNLKDTLIDLEKVTTNIKMKSEYLGDIAKAAEEEFEIKEECPENYVHPKDRKRVSRVKDEKSESDSPEVKNQDDKLINEKHEDLLKRLDELELLEEEEDGINSSESDDEYIDSDDSDSSIEEENQQKIKKVSFNDESCNKPQSCTIRFQHTAKAHSSKSNHELTPGDVHKLVKQPQSKSILKKTKHDESPSSSHAVQLGTAVSDIVVEREVEVHEEIKTTMQTRTSTKPVSKFKAGRRK